MSSKRTFMYRIEMGHHPNVSEIAFCYARNKDVAISNMQNIFKSKRYNMFKAYKFGEAEQKIYSGPFKLFSKDEEEYFKRTKSTVGEQYAERRNNISGIYKDTGFNIERGDFVSGENKESISSEGESISDINE